MGVVYFLLLSSLGFAINTQAQDCSAPVGGDNMGLKGDDILLQTFPNGVQVTFVCNIGYTGRSSRITCTDGSWSPVMLKCEIKSCGSAGTVVNGDIDYSEGIDFGAKLVVTCNTGYILVGKSHIICGDEGWLSRLPQCEVVTCSPLDSVVAGTFSPIAESYEFQQVVQVTCQKDYTLIGSKSLTCSEDGTFKPAPPTCVMVECKDPVIEFAVWVGGSRPPHDFKSTVTYKCKSGYDMKGAGTLTCGVDGQWLPGLPTCEPVTCSPPDSVVAGTFSPMAESYELQQVVQVTCQKDYKLIGSKSLTCSEDGTFKPAPPTCVMVECKDPVIEFAVWVEGSRPPHDFKSTVTYKCKSGYDMKGAGTLTCGVDGQWLPGLPTCELVQCKNPVIKHAIGVGGSLPPYNYKSTVTFMCESGYDMKGAGTLTCGVDGQWLPGLPTCEHEKRWLKVLLIVLGVLVFLVVAGLVLWKLWPFIKRRSGRSSPDNNAPKEEETVALPVRSK